MHPLSGHPSGVQRENKSTSGPKDVTDVARCGTHLDVLAHVLHLNEITIDGQRGIL